MSIYTVLAVLDHSASGFPEMDLRDRHRAWRRELAQTRHPRWTFECLVLTIVFFSA